MAQALNGQLRDFSLPDVLQFLLQQRKSGRLVLVNRSQKAELGISRGNISHVEIDSRTVETVVRDWLLATGRLTQDEFHGVESVSRSMDRSVLETLVAKKFITAEERADWVQLVAEDLVCELFLWQDGSYELNTDVPAVSARAVALNLSTEMVTMEGMRRMDEWPRLQDRLSGPGIQIALSAPPPPGTDLGIEGLVLQALGASGERVSLDELSHKVPFGRFRLYDTIVAFADSGYVTLQQDGRSFGVLPAVEQEVATPKASSSAVLVAASLLVLVGALVVNWIAGAAVGRLSSSPVHGFAGAEARFEVFKLHTAVLRYRFGVGEWPRSLERTNSVFPLTKGERTSSIGLRYGYQVQPPSYILWLRNRPREESK